MRGLISLHARRGITVLTLLLLLIITLVVAGILLARYLRSRPAATSSTTPGALPNQPISLLIS
jgi:hypothetical protein